MISLFFLLILIPSILEVRRLLQELNITRNKCITVAREKYSPYVLQEHGKMYFFDETSFSTETDEREYGRAEYDLYDTY